MAGSDYMNLEFSNSRVAAADTTVSTGSESNFVKEFCT